MDLRLNTTRFFGACIFALSAAISPMAPSALAAPQVKTTEKFGEPMSEAVTLIKNKRFRDALAKVEKAAPLAKSQAEKLAVEQMRTAIYSGLGRRVDLINSLESQLTIGGLSAATIKAHRLTLAGLYDREGNDAKAVALTKAYIKDYGGKPEQHAFVASYDLKKGRYAEAVGSASKAINGARASGSKPREEWRKIVMRAEFERGNLPAYYAAVEQTALEYPREAYFRILFDRASKEPRFSHTLHRLDIYRALVAADVDLTAKEKADMAERAYTRGLSGEAGKILQQLSDRNYAGLEASQIARLKRMHSAVKADSREELNQLTAFAIKSSKGDAFITLGEAFVAAGQPKQAIEAINKGLGLGGLDPGEVDFARLQLGVAQFRAGQVDAARKTWNSIKSDNGAHALARGWTLISKADIA